MILQKIGPGLGICLQKFYIKFSWYARKQSINYDPVMTLTCFMAWPPVHFNEHKTFKIMASERKYLNDMCCNIETSPMTYRIILLYRIFYP